MPIDPEKKRLVNSSEFVRADIEVSSLEAGKTGVFSATKHRYYTARGLAGNAKQDRVAYLMEIIAEFSLRTGSDFPYAFADRRGDHWSIDARCLNAIGPNHLGLVQFVEDGGYVVAVRLNPSVLEQHGTMNGTAADIDLLSKDGNLTTTQREQLINARLGQGRFRAQVLASWKGRCAVTSCELGVALRASHILPWRDANNTERLDPENGLPLVATLDALFDAGLISFDEDGLMLRSRTLHAHPNLVDQVLRLSRLPSDRMRAYLRGHRERFGFPSCQEQRRAESD